MTHRRANLLTLALKSELRDWALSLIALSSAPTIGETAERLGVSTRTLYRWIESDVEIRYLLRHVERAEDQVIS